MTSRSFKATFEIPDETFGTRLLYHHIIAPSHGEAIKHAEWLLNGKQRGSRLLNVSEFDGMTVLTPLKT